MKRNYDEYPAVAVLDDEDSDIQWIDDGQGSDDELWPYGDDSLADTAGPGEAASHQAHSPSAGSDSRGSKDDGHVQLLDDNALMTVLSNASSAHADGGLNPYPDEATAPPLHPSRPAADGGNDDHGGDDDDSGAEDASDDRRARVNVCDQDVAAAAEASIQMIVRENGKDPKNPLLFYNGNRISRFERNQDGQTILVHADIDIVTYQLTRMVNYFRATKLGGVKKAVTPACVVRDILATPDLGLPVVDGVTPFPVYGTDGTLQTEAGYSPNTRLYYEPPIGFDVPAVPAAPTAEQVGAARDLLLNDMLGDFPFTALSERAHALVLILTPYVRSMIAGPVPMALIEKPSPGTGATLLVDVATSLAMGRPSGVMTVPGNEEEMRKLLLSAHMGTDAFHVFDNVRGRLDSAALAADLTAEYHVGRVLGKSQIVRLRIRACRIATANNASLSKELSRRVYRIRMDAKLERPWLRSPGTFRHPDLPGWVAENRSHLVWSALVLIQAWIAAGRPQAPAQPVMGMYERWSAVMGGILHTAGVTGFLGNMTELYDSSDDESAPIRAFVGAWESAQSDRSWLAAHPDRAVKAADLFSLALTSDPPLDLGDKGERSQKIRLGSLLSRHRDTQFGNVRIVAAGDAQRAKLWRLDPVA